MRSLKNKFRITTAILGVSVMLGAVSLSSAVTAQELKGFAKGYMKFTEEHLDKVEQMLGSGLKNNAASELKKAKYQFGKYESRDDADQQHPRAVSVRERMAKYEAMIAGKPAPAPAPKVTAQPAKTELKGFAKNYLEFAEEEIARTETNLSSGLPSNAMTSLDKAKYQMQKFEGTGPENQKHPRAIVAKEKIAKYDAQIKAHFAGKKAAEGTSRVTEAPKVAAPTVSAKGPQRAPDSKIAPTVSAKAPQRAPETTSSANTASTASTATAQVAAAPAQSAKSDEEWEEIIVMMDEHKGIIAKHTYFPKFENVSEISTAFSGFDQAIGDAKRTLEGYEAATAAGQKPAKPRLALYAEDYAQNLRATLNSYGGRKDKYIQKSFDEAKTAIEHSNEAIKRANDSLKKDRKLYEAGQAVSWMDAAFDQYDLIVKALGENATADQKSQIMKINADRKDVESNLAAIDSSVAAAEAARIAKNRFPSGYSDSVDGDVLAAAEAEFGTKILRSAEIEPWTERTEARWVNNGWVVGHFKYYQLWLAKEVDGGKTYVYSMRFRQKQLSPGSWSKTHYHSVGTVFEVLPENLDK